MSYLHSSEDVEWTSDGVRKLSDQELAARLSEELELCYNSARISLLKAESRRRKEERIANQLPWPPGSGI